MLNYLPKMWARVGLGRIVINIKLLKICFFNKMCNEKITIYKIVLKFEMRSLKVMFIIKNFSKVPPF